MHKLSRRGFIRTCAGAVAASAAFDAAGRASSATGSFDGTYFAGEGDVRYLRLLETAARMYYPDPELQNISMLYSPAWNGFVEGPTWGAWWIQNSYGPSYCALPFLTEPYTTFLQNSQNLWFSQMGDGKRKGANDWVAPDGCLCDAAAPGWIYYKQGDGRTDIHDWGMEFTAAGVVLQAELLLISRDPEAVGLYLPLLERSANFIETRRDPRNDLFLAGPAGNLLAPSYAGWHKPDGTYDKAYLAGLSVTYIAGLDRLIELEKMTGNMGKVAVYEDRRHRAKQGLKHLTTDEGYLIKYMDPDGTKHGVYGAARHGYFEAICNHDAIAFRVVDDAQARRIYDKIASIPGLRPHDVIITNCPGLDDLYVEPTGLWSFGHWTNGGHWTTCEARMMMAYYRLGQYEDARRSMEHILRFARVFRMDNNLTDFGARVYQPNQPINCVYDTWGAPAALIRGLFEYLYTAEGLKLLPHIPPGITRLDQRFPIRFGDKRLYLSTRGSGAITSVWMNGRPWKAFTEAAVSLADDDCPDKAHIVVCLGGATPGALAAPKTEGIEAPLPGAAFWDLSDFATMPAGNGRPLRIGADSGGEHRFVGAMRRVRVYGQALTPEQIAALGASPDAATPTDAACVVDCDLRRFADGQVPNAALSDLPGKAVGDMKAGDGQALAFDGSAYLDFGNDPRLVLPEAFTLEAWICPAKLPDGGARIIDKITSGRDDGYLLDTCPGNSLRLITERGVLSYDARLEPGQWAHVTATYEAKGELRLYVDGKLVASTRATESPTVAGSVELERIGLLHTRLCEDGMGERYEARHAELVIRYVRAMHERAKLRAAGKLTPIPPDSQAAADQSYLDAASRLAQGLAKTIEAYGTSDDDHKRRVLAIWRERAPLP